MNGTHRRTKKLGAISDASARPNGPAKRRDTRPIERWQLIVPDLASRVRGSRMPTALALERTASDEDAYDRGVWELLGEK